MAILFEFKPFKWEFLMQSYHPFNRPDRWPHKHTHIHFGPFRVTLLRGSTLFLQACQAVHHGTEANFHFMGDMQAQADERQARDLEWAQKALDRECKNFHEEQKKNEQLRNRVRELEECLRVLKTVPEVEIAILPPEPPPAPKGPEPVEIKP